VLESPWSRLRHCLLQLMVVFVESLPSCTPHLAPRLGQGPTATRKLGDARHLFHVGSRSARAKAHPRSNIGLIGLAAAPLYGEASRKYRRTVYHHEDWLKHRTPRRFKSLRDMLFSGVVRSLLRQVLCVTVIAACVVAWNLLFNGWVDFSNVQHAAPLGYRPSLILRLPALPFTLSTSPLGLLLVFRTNACYRRWLDARITWGRIVSASRNLLRQASTWSMAEGDARKLEMEGLASWTWAFSRCLAAFLRGPSEDHDLAADLQAALGQDAAARLLSARHRPIVALRELSACVKNLTVDAKDKTELDKNIIALLEACEVCERIFSAPVPLVYTRHTSRFLTTWVLLLPLAFWVSFANSWNQLAVIPSTALSALFLFGIDELAVQLEEPFSILPLEIFCAEIHASTREFIQESLR